MTGSDDSAKLAPVTYLFGGAASRATQETQGTAGTEEEWAKAASTEPSEPDSAPRPASARGARKTAVEQPATRRLREMTEALLGSAEKNSAVDLDEAEPTEEELASDRAGEADRAHNIALHALGRKGVSVSEMSKLLKSRDLDEETVEAEIARLEAVGLLDDGALAETLVRTLQERKGLGRSGVSNELRRRGIEQEAITLALETDDDGDDEAARALELALKRAPQLRSYDNDTAKRRLSGFLMRRGYSGQVVSAAVNAALDANGGGASRGPRFR